MEFNGIRSYHFKHGQCEQCGSKLDYKNVTLQVVNFWTLNSNSRRIPNYLYVCENCFKSRKTWCENIFPEKCEMCNQVIEYGDHYLEKELNQMNEKIKFFGLLPDEKCRIICYDCYKSTNKEN